MASASVSTAPAEPGTTGMPSSTAVFLAVILSPMISIWCAEGPMKVTLCSVRILAKRAFSERKP
ncbi:hypothetical protein D3C86_2033180 [compost metagenome]